jgi:hypothetical protein
MNIKPNTVYKTADGYFKSVKKDGKLVMANPSYPFAFLPEVLGDMEEIGSVEKFGHLIKKENHQFIEGETLSVKVTDDGNLEPIKN